MTVARPVDTEKIQESIKLLKEGNIPYEFRTTVLKSMLSPENFDEIGELIRGAKIYYLQKFVPTKILNPNFLNKAVYTDEELEEIKETMEKYVSVCKIR